MASLMATVLAAVAALGKKGGTHGAYEVINVPSQGHQARRSTLLDAGYSNHRQLYHSPVAEHVAYNEANESRIHSDYK